MEKQFFIGPKDVLRFTWYVRISKNRWRGFILFYATCMILFNFFIRLFNTNNSNGNGFGSIVFWAVLVFLIVFGVLSAIRSAYKQDDTLGNIRLLIHQNGLEYITPSSEALLYWKMIKGFYITKRYLYLMSGANRGIIIPRRAFESSEEETAFIDQIKAYYSDSQGTPLILSKRDRGSAFSRVLSVFFIIMNSLVVLLVVIGILNYIVTKK